MKDTWGPLKYAAAWQFAVDPPSGGWTNAEVAAHLRRLVDVTAPWLRIWRAWLDADTPELAGPHHRPDDQPAASFHEALAARIERAEAPIGSMELTLDLWAWVCIAPQSEPVEGWIRAGAEIDLALANGPYLALSIDHTLFTDGDPPGSNRALHLLNRPALAELLAVLGTTFGPLQEVEGIDAVRPDGFATSA